MRDTFVKYLTELAKENKNIELITGDLGFGVLKPFWEQCPNQFTNAGIAEQNMTSVAAGMSTLGKIVFTYSIGNFPTLRCLEQIRNDCAYHNANVKIVCVGGGFTYGSLGMSHHATEDISIMRALPNVAVFAPADPTEACACTQAMIDYQGTAYIRLGRGGEKALHKNLSNYKIGQALKIRNGKNIAIFSTGAIMDEVLNLTNKLEENNYNPYVYSFPTVKPIDKDLITKMSQEVELIVTYEENNCIGGFGSAVAEITAELPNSKAKLLRIGLNDTYCETVGDQYYLRQQYDLDAKSAFNKVAVKIKELGI